MASKLHEAVNMSSSQRHVERLQDQMTEVHESMSQNEQARDATEREMQQSAAMQKEMQSELQRLHTQIDELNQERHAV